MENIYQNSTNNVYNIKLISELFSLHQEVEFDQIINAMNEAFSDRVSYDILPVQEGLIYKYILYTPLKVVCMYFSANNAEKINSKAEECFVKLVEKYFARTIKKDKDNKTNITNNDIPTNPSENKDGIALTTLDDINKAEKEMLNTNASQDNNNKITKEQVIFINNFKEEYKIDTDEKFNKYIETWNKFAHTNIHTKAELIKAGYQAVQSFIMWIKTTKESVSQETAFVTPSSEDVGFPW